PVAAPGSLEKLAREQKVDQLFLTLLDRWIGQGRNLSHKSTANTYAPNRFIEEPEVRCLFLQAGLSCWSALQIAGRGRKLRVARGKKDAAFRGCIRRLLPYNYLEIIDKLPTYSSVPRNVHRISVAAASVLGVAVCLPQLD